jgi:hypothetical protein
MSSPAPFVTPEFVSIGELLKATPQSDGGRRFLYIEASNEGVDQQGEIVAAKALAEAAPYYLRYGNCDLEHFTLIGAKVGIPNYTHYEIGQPVEVGQKDGKTFVKAEIYKGDGPAAEKANEVWAGLTEITPPQRWYPSVGGKVLEKTVTRDDRGEAASTILSRIRWVNIGMSKTPVNQHVPECTTIPIGVFAKCWSEDGVDLVKALTAGYGTDSAGFTGAAALREQSLDRKVKDTTIGSYFDFREKMAGALRKGEVGASPNAEAMFAHATGPMGLSHDQGSAFVERFMRDLASKMKSKS